MSTIRLSITSPPCHKFFYFPYLILSPASIDAPDAPDGADGADAPLYFDALMRPVKGTP